MKLVRRLPCVFVGISLLIAQKLAALPAFPGAEGAGANAIGGRGGDVYFVTNTANTGAGSLRTGISTATGPRTILFRVSGTIDLLSDLSINKPYLTIAGQSAPGDGITLRRRTTKVSDTHDVIVRHIRSRAGDLDSSFEGDSLWVVNATNTIIDHVSTSWSVDECLSVTWSTNVTVQWCLISESLSLSQHSKGAHGYGSLLRYAAGALTFHHNLYQHHDSRNPRLGDNLKLDFVNNVVYNWGGTAGYNANDWADNLGFPSPYFTNFLNYVSNYCIAGPSTGNGHLSVIFDSGVTNSTSCQIYQSGNIIDTNKNTLVDGSNTGWSMFGSPYLQLANRYPLPLITSDTPATAYQRVLAFGGASRVRDSVDTRLIGTVRSQSGRLVDAVGPANQATDYVTNNILGTNYVFVRGWPALNSTVPPPDVDNDGIADYWELALGWNPAVPNNNHINADGYTDLEWYLNWLADPRAVCDRNGYVDVNLRQVSGGYSNLVFTAADGTNGTVTLLGDGYTARFSPAPNFSGLANFTFNASDPTSVGSFGPVPIAVLVSITNAPNTPPILAGIPNQTVVAGTTINFAASVTDTDSPPQSVTFLLNGGVSGATLGTNDGVFQWRPIIAQSGTTNLLSIIATDSGIPSASSTQAFTIIVNSPVQPTMQPAGFSGSIFNVQVSGDFGPDYTVQSSTNLIEWADRFSTNSPTLPFLWSDPGAGGQEQKFYRMRLGP